jgi:hypothetical protein
MPPQALSQWLMRNSFSEIPCRTKSFFTGQNSASFFKSAKPLHTLGEAAVFSQRFIKNKYRVNPTIGYKNDLPIWYSGRMTIESDFKIAVLDRKKTGSGDQPQRTQRTRKKQLSSLRSLCSFAANSGVRFGSAARFRSVCERGWGTVPPSCLSSRGFQLSSQLSLAMLDSLPTHIQLR